MLDINHHQLLSSLKHYFGYDSFRTGQVDVITNILQGKDCLVLMPTGGGKSICYQLPAIILPGITIVISPLISLMKDQVDALTRQGIVAAYVNSSLNQQEIHSIFQRLSQGKIKLLYVAPERINNYYFRHGLSQLNISLFAIDECHCISQWGHDFRPAYTQLTILKKEFSHIPMMALTATADVTTRKDILQQLDLKNPYIYLDSFDRPNIRLTLADKYNGLQQVLGYIKQRQNDAGIIYCNSRWQVENITKALFAKGVNCAAYHAGFDTQIRHSVQEKFAKDQIQVVIATIAFGLGIDKSNVRFVIHYQPPRSLESYYQEIGRAGRDGLAAEALLLYDKKDVDRLTKHIAQGENVQRVNVEMQKFQAIKDFIEAQTCRRKVILNYFAEFTESNCENCDICLDPPRQFDGTTATKMVLSCVYRIKQQGDSDHIVAILRADNSHKVTQLEHHKVSTFGIGKNKTASYWYAIIKQLIHLGYLQQDIAAHSNLCLTQAAVDFLKNDQAIMLASPRLQKASYWQGKKQDKKYDQVLFSKLRSLRKEIADLEDIAPFIIFNDATLAELAKNKPQTPLQMLAINGIGDIKLARYGEPFLNIIKYHQQEK